MGVGHSGRRPTAFMSAFDVAAPLHWDGQPTPGLRPAYRHLSLAKIPIALGMCNFLAKVGLHLVYTWPTPPQPMRVFQLVVTQAELNMGAFLVEVGLHPVDTRPTPDLHPAYSSISCGLDPVCNQPVHFPW